MFFRQLGCCVAPAAAQQLSEDDAPRPELGRSCTLAQSTKQQERRRRGRERRAQRSHLRGMQSWRQSQAMYSWFTPAPTPGQDEVQWPQPQPQPQPQQHFLASPAEEPVRTNPLPFPPARAPNRLISTPQTPSARQASEPAAKQPPAAADAAAAAPSPGGLQPQEPTPQSPAASPPQLAEAETGMEEAAEPCPSRVSQVPSGLVEKFRRHVDDMDGVDAPYDVQCLTRSVLPPPVAAAAHAEGAALAVRLQRLVLDDERARADGEPQLLDAFLDAPFVQDVAAGSDTCSGAGRRTERAARSRDNLRHALALARARVAEYRGRMHLLPLTDMYMAVNARVYQDVMEHVPAHYMGRSRAVGGFDVKAGAIEVFPAAAVDAAMCEVQAYVRRAACDDAVPRVEIVARCCQALVSIHPCPDGNGRTAACVSAALAEAFGLPPFHLMSRHFLRAYVQQLPRRENPTPIDAIRETLRAMERSVAQLQTLAEERRTKRSQAETADGRLPSRSSAAAESGKDAPVPVPAPASPVYSDLQLTFGTEPT
eukprot:Rhum_TRINITY_DN4119_c0_g1::Rhum_TRINITY_DN4119_c0_g1_i1::g.13001::m.13001